MRSIKLNREMERFKTTKEKYADGEIKSDSRRAYKKTLVKKCELTADELNSIIQYWRRYKPTISELAARFKVKSTTAGRLIR